MRGASPQFDTVTSIFCPKRVEGIPTIKLERCKAAAGAANTRSKTALQTTTINNLL